MGFELRLLITESGGCVPKAVQAPERKPEPKRRTPCCRQKNAQISADVKFAARFLDFTGYRI